jgi:predicted nucleic acid-binding protein
MLKVRPPEADEVPYYSTYLRLNLPVWAATRQVLRAAQSKLKRRGRYLRATRLLRHQYYRSILKHHKIAQDLYRAVQRGEFGYG